MPRFTQGMVFKISVVILVLVTLVLAAMGHFYVSRFHQEVDNRIRTAAQFPGTLMDERSLSFDAARDLAAMSRLVGEEVIEAAVLRSDGQVFYASDRGKEDSSVADAYGEVVAQAIRPERSGPDLFPAARGDQAHLISIAPIRSDGKLIGFLYLKVDTRRSETEKKNILVLFTLGSLLCILLTTLAEVVIVHYLITPRIRRTVDCLKAVEGGDLAARVAKADSEDEIGVMQRSVNDMVDEVENLVDEVQHVNERLEAQIAERRRSEQVARDSEQRFRDLAELLPEIIYEMDAKGRLTFVNRQGMERFGFTEADKGKGQNAIEFLVPEDRRRALENINRLFKGELKGGREYTMRGRDGAMMPVIIFSAPILRDGKPVGLRGLIVDMSRQKDLEERLRQAAKMEAVGTLAGGIAHDFNNILQAISGYAELLLEGAPDQEVHRQHVVQIDRASNRGAELVRSLLAFSRKDEPALRPLDLNREVLQTVRLLERTIPKMIRIETRLAADLHQVHADPGQLAQVVMNLGANARDAMTEGGAFTIETRNTSLDEDYCSVHPEARPGPYVELRVSDTGEGIPQEMLGHIYDPFFTTKDVGSGTGLGLSTVYGVIKGHGGQITCQSLPGKGTTFVIHLPARIIEEPRESRPAPLVDRAEGGSETVLIVDDEEPVVKLAKTLLGRRGYDVLTAISGEEALEIYRARPGEIDLVILDLGMPGMGGEKCLEELLRFDPEARVMIASGYNMDAQADDVLQAGAKDFVSKPYRLDELVRRVRKVLDG